MTKNIFLSFILFSFIQSSLQAKEFKATKIVDGLGVAWAIEEINASTLLITNRRGKYHVVDLKTKSKKTYKFPLEVKRGGQGGLLDIEKHPDFKKNQLVYFTFSKEQAGDKATTALARGKWNTETQTVESVSEIFEAKASTDTSRHYGSRLTFDKEGNLFMSIGDRGHRPNGQDLKVHAGKILRLTMDGKAANGNPFESDKNALDEIWSYGHRNPQGLYFDDKTQTLWAIEHGPRGGDEINIIEQKKNYGWAQITYGKEYWGPFQVGEGVKKEGMEQPWKYYVPSIAPSDLVLYRGKNYPSLNSSLITGALALQHLNIIKVDKRKEIKETRALEKLEERFRSILISTEDKIYFGTDSGILYLLSE